MNLYIRKYKPGDEYKILDLFNEVFNKEMKLEYWRWIYDKEGSKYINLMWDDEVLAGHYAVVPIKIKFNNSIIESGFSMTTMTSQNYKKLGIFTKLARQLYDDSYNELKIIWGFPNKNSLHGFTKYLNWNELGEINMLIINIELLEKNLKSTNSCINTVNKFSDEYNKLFLQISSEYNFIVKRDSDYLNWRFVKNPLNKYSILEYRENNILRGYAVYKIYHEGNISHGDIVDFLAINQDIFTELISTTLIYIKKHNARFSNIWTTDLNYEKILRNMGFKDRGSKTYFGILENGEIEMETDIANHYITMSDSDVF